MLHWAYCENLQSDDVTVSDAEAHHLIHVLRCRTGTNVTLFDGQGTEATAEVVSVTRRDLTCAIRSRIQHARPSRPEFTVIASPPKADRLKMMVEKLTEIGVDRLVLLNTLRTVTTPGETRLDKIHSSMIAACKQCRRPFFMELSPLQSMQAALSELQPSTTNPLICIAHPETNNNLTDLYSQTQITRPAAVLIGPEGGFTEDEVQAAISCGGRTYILAEYNSSHRNSSDRLLDLNNVASSSLISHTPDTAKHGNAWQRFCGKQTPEHYLLSPC